MIQGSMSRLLFAIVLLLTSTASAVVAHASSLNPGDLLVAAQGLPGTIHHLSATGTDLGAFVTNNLQSFGWITIHANGDVYVSEVKLDIFSASGTQLMQFDTGFGPRGVSLDANGNLYVANWGEGSVRRFSPTGAELGVFASGLVRPRALAIVPGPTAKDQCKNGGWDSFEFPRPFKNEGYCIQFVNRGK